MLRLSSPTRVEISRALRYAIVFMMVTLAAANIHGQTQEDAAKGQALFNSGTEMLGKGDFPGAIQKFTEAISILPGWHLPYLNRGVAHLSLLKLAEAEADANKAIALIKTETPSATLHTGIAHQVKGTVKQHLGDYKAALEQFTIALELVPSDAKFHQSKGTALRLLGRNEEALASYDKAIALDPKIAQFYVNRASIHEKLKNPEASLKDLDDALKLDKNLGPAYYTRGTLRMRSKAYVESLADFDEAIRLEPTKSVYFHARGLLYFATKKFDLAIKDHTQAIALDTKNSNAYADRAIASGNLGNSKAAIDDLRVAISLNNDSAALRYNLSYFLFRNGQFSESVDAASQVISRSPTWRSPYLLRSNGYVKLGMAVKAKADRDKAAMLSSDGRPTNEPYLVFDVEVFVPKENKP